MNSWSFPLGVIALTACPRFIVGGRRSSGKPRAAVDGGCVLDGFINNLKGKVAIVTGAASGIRSPFIFELPAGQPKAMATDNDTGKTYNGNRTHLHI